MKKLLLISIIVMVSSLAFADKDRGGGDICEDRIKLIRSDIRSWILNRGSDELRLPTGNVDQYNQRMLSHIATAQVRCVGSGDEGFPVEVFGRPKICRFDQSTSHETVTCDLTKFLQLTEDQQYVLIHHEYAGLADIEIPNAADSNYQVSNQISSFLIDEVIRRLAVRSSSTNSYANTAFVITGISSGSNADGFELKSPNGATSEYIDCNSNLFSTIVVDDSGRGSHLDYNFTSRQSCLGALEKIRSATSDFPEVILIINQTAMVAE